MARKATKIWPRTVSQALLDAWQELRRKGDPQVMAKELGYSRPVIDKALIYGFISFPELPDKINKFFMDRLKAEEKQAAGLLAQADKVKNLTGKN